ncbi:MAG: hypothetical protein ACSHXW_14310 [Yoonia sp.]
MKHREKPVASPSTGSQAKTNDPDKNSAQTPEQDKPRKADDSSAKTDRPGADLGGSSGDTHAGTGLGLGNNSSDTAGDRRLPGRRLDNDLTIPRWVGPAPHGKSKPAKKPSGG